MRILCFCIALAAMRPADAAVLSSSSTVNMVRFFLKTPTAQLPADAVPDFLDVDADRLPAKLREPYRAKKLELLALRNVAEGKNKPPVRRAGEEPLKSCGDPDKMEKPGLLLQSGFGEISSEEESKLMAETKCTECELRSEFTLVIAETKAGKSRKRRYFLHDKDPLWILVTDYRSRKPLPKGTPFYGIGAGGIKCR